MKPLPVAESSVTIPSMLTVRGVADSEDCMLKLVASGSDWRPKYLATGPEAAIGRLLHSIYDKWGRGEGADEPGLLFDDELTAMRESLRTDERSRRFEDLQTTKTPLEWINVRRKLIARCRATPRGRKAPSSGGVGAGQRRFGAEVWLEDRELRLRGRADEIRDESGTIVIRDYKTGAVNADDGQMRPSISLQLRLYAMIVERWNFGRPLRLEVVSPGRSEIIAWNGDARISTDEEIRNVVRRLPEGKTIPARSLASPGAGCRHCPLRHRCESYLMIAPSWWTLTERSEGRLPNDIWGRVERISSRDGRHTVDLRDEAARHVRITDLDGEGTELSEGDRAYYFNLERSGRGAGWTSSSRQAQDFHELPPDSSARRAWTLEAFAAPVERS